MASAHAPSAAVSPAVVLRVVSSSVYATTMPPATEIIKAERRAKILRIAGGLLSFACFVAAFALWVSGAREAFGDCDADACTATATGIAKAAAFDYAKNHPADIFVGLVLCATFAGCILFQVFTATSRALFRALECGCGLCDGGTNTVLVLAISIVLLSALVGLYYGAQDNISMECCPERPSSAPAATIASFVVAALPALGVVGGVVGLNVYESCRQKRADAAMGPDVDTQMAMRLLVIS